MTLWFHDFITLRFKQLNIHKWSFQKPGSFRELIFNGIIIEIAAGYRYDNCYNAEEHKIQCLK
jgi:hypothetical protein